MLHIARSFRFLLEPGTRDRFLELYRPLADHVIGHEPDTQVFLVNRDKEDPNHVYVFAIFKDDAARARHYASSVRAEVLAKVAPLVRSTEELENIVLRGKGLGPATLERL